MKRELPIVLAVITSLFLLLPNFASSQDEKIYEFNIPAQLLRTALLQFGVRAELNIVIPDDLLPDAQSLELYGYMSRSQALEKLLQNLDMSYLYVGKNALRIFWDNKENIDESKYTGRSRLNANAKHVILNYKPLQSITLRAVRSQAIRAPNLGELFARGNQGFAYIHDYCDETDEVVPVR